MRTASFMKRCSAVVIDEAHCISEWGANFRKDYRDLEKLRAMVPIGVPFLAASATLPPAVRSEVKARLGYTPSRTYEVNLGNDRPNITLLCSYLKSADDLDALTPAIQEALDGSELVKSMIFVNTRTEAYAMCHHLRSLVPDKYKTEIDFLHAGRSRRARQRVLRRFRAGKIKVLCATEAAGMVSDAFSRVAKLIHAFSRVTGHGYS